ncbi:MAG: hypothetical protein PVH21_07405 [Myxococcales bacterium]|jgi:hypothetical protein
MSADIGVGELLEELEERGARLPFEIGAFVALEACEGLLHHAVKIEPNHVRVTLDGSVVVTDSAERTVPDEAARSLVSVLARLLVAAGPGIPPDLLQLVKEGTTGQRLRGLRELHDAIEASLIPINRGASRRVLARLVRDSDRPPAAKEPELDPLELDAELDELLRDPEVRTPAPAPAEPPEADLDDEPITERIRFPRPPQAEVEPPPPAETAAPRPARIAQSAEVTAAPQPAAASLALAEQEPVVDSEPITQTIRKWTTAPEAPQPEPEPNPEDAPVSVSRSIPVTEAELETPTEAVFGTGSVTASPEDTGGSPRTSAPATDSAPDRPSRALAPLPKRRGSWGIWLFAAGLGLVIYAGLAAGAFDPWLRPEGVAPSPGPSGVIDVRVSPSNAQIFVFVGRGPAIAEDMSVGSAHEFLVFDKGLQPARAFVPKDATWTRTENGPLYELAIQAEPADSPSSALDLGTARVVPTDATSGPGKIRIVTNPPGAKVYRFVGRGPTVRIRVPSIHEGQEVLVYDSGYETRRAVIGPSDWQPVEGREGYRASLEVELPVRSGSTTLQSVEE